MIFGRIIQGSSFCCSCHNNWYLVLLFSNYLFLMYRFAPVLCIDLIYDMLVKLMSLMSVQ